MTGADQQVAMLRILVAACETARDAFQAAANPVDAELLADLERVIKRSRDELAVLTENFVERP